MNADRVIAFDVHDTGIGARRTSNGSSSKPSSRPTARRPGNTAVPASASRSVVRSRGCWGGTLQVVSAPGQGSTFTCYLPVTYQPQAPSAQSGGGPARGRLGAERDAAAIALDGERDTPNPLNDDRDDIQPGDDLITDRG